jgi:hypothetical protein
MATLQDKGKTPAPIKHKRRQRRRLVNAGIVPHTITGGRVLAHNDVPHANDTPSGTGGFYAWTQNNTDGLEPCEWRKIAASCRIRT